MKKIPLTQGKFAIVDDADFETLIKHRWNFQHGYARRIIYEQCRGKNLYMHREILKTEKGMEVDHIDGNGLNNQRSNLRVVTSKANSWNMKSHTGSSSKYKGVSWNKKKQKWVAQISVLGKNKFLGYYTSDIDAAKARDEASRKYHGEFSRLNIAG